jgi:hypothetical protein
LNRFSARYGRVVQLAYDAEAVVPGR